MIANNVFALYYVVSYKRNCTFLSSSNSLREEVEIPQELSSSDEHDTVDDVPTYEDVVNDKHEKDLPSYEDAVTNKYNMESLA